MNKELQWWAKRVSYMDIHRVCCSSAHMSTYRLTINIASPYLGIAPLLTFSRRATIYITVLEV